MGTSRRFWRWRRNPLKRGSDRVEAWALLVSGLLLVVGAPTVGVETGLAMTADAHRPAADWKAVSAVVIHKAPPPSTITGVDSGDRPVLATVRWHVPGGHDHTGHALVRPNSPAGTRTTIWLDRNGHVHQDLVDPLSAAYDGIAFGFLTGTATAMFAGGSYAAIRCALDRRRAAALAYEWAVIGPEWRRHRT